MGRRWFCSSLCLFNGFAAEDFDPVMPLIGKRRKIRIKQSGRSQQAAGKGSTFRFFAHFRWIYFAAVLLFTGYWILQALGIGTPDSGTAAGGSLFSAHTMNIMASIETWKYLFLELLMAMFFWVAFIGRGYCLYCPVGTLFGLIGRLIRQKIITNETNCVGCGHCVDICPTETLRYSTLSGCLDNHRCTKPLFKKRINDLLIHFAI